ncbi:hypothetical protein TNIN_271901 [Trichonephila inaurata madagascariensis]|uniref:Uncharacterized protein n=1 Tax=Trichonephila inaurata madagascariensis TaxID=2747483 RepID=A0A8X6MDZ5_9ARAC|nr:hypothetical protein TNIN_271901 [Trichonephila inaurata madagascariensis]
MDWYHAFFSSRMYILKPIMESIQTEIHYVYPLSSLQLPTTMKERCLQREKMPKYYLKRREEKQLKSHEKTFLLQRECCVASST